MKNEHLMALGATLVMLGIIARNLDAGQRRVAAMRKQHDLDERKLGESVKPEPHLEKHLRRYANAGIVLGLLLLGIGALR